LPRDGPGASWNELCSSNTAFNAQLSKNRDYTQNPSKRVMASVEKSRNSLQTGVGVEASFHASL
jgi:hypothetical protein